MKRLFPVGLLLLVASGCLRQMTDRIDETNCRMSMLQSELQLSNAQLASMRQSAAILDRKYDHTTTQLTQAGQTAQSMDSKMDKMTAGIAETNASMQRMENELKQANKTFKSLEGVLKKIGGLAPGGVGLDEGPSIEASPK